jgi:putative DNA primase/helicase
VEVRVKASELERALRAAHLRPGERFELAVRTPSDAFLARPFVELESACAWLAHAPAGDVYLGLNPIRAEVAFPPGRARDADVALVRCLLVDCDPEGQDHAAAGELADMVAARLASSCGLRATRIHTGRGRQLWLEHETVLPSDTRLAVRSRLLRALGARFNLVGRAHVDPVVHNVARLARLPGTINSRTGAVAAIEDEGESTPALLSDLEHLTLALEAEVGPKRVSHPRPAPRAPDQPSVGAWPARYVAAAVAKILAKMHEAHEGARNDTLNRCAFALGQLAAGGACVEPAFEELREAALAGGLELREVERTIASGWDAGGKEPRARPRPRERRSCEKRARTSPAPRKPKRARVGLTDLGNARRLLRGHGADLRFSATAGGWFVWDGERWRVDQTGEAPRRARSVPRMIFLKAARMLARVGDAPDKEARDRLCKRADALRKHAIKSESERALKALLAIAQAEPGIPVLPDALDADPWLLNVRNGTLNLRTGTLQAHRREDLITKIVPIHHDARATCPTWLAFLDRVLGGSAGLASFLQKAVGYALTGETSEQVLFLLHGTGANGKSTFMETIRALLGDFALQASFETFLSKNDSSRENAVARLRGARFVSAVEAEAGGKLNEVLVKTLTGGDTVTARFLYREFFEYEPAFKIFLAANHKPTIRGNDHAIWRRIRLVPFTVTIPEAERDSELKAKLEAELPGILNWAVEGCLAWQREGLGQPPEIEEATAEYREEMDALGPFVHERCETFADSSTGSGELYKAFAAWSELNGERPMSQKAFSLRLAERGFARRRSGGNGSRVWFGIGLATGQGSLLTGADGSYVSSGKSPEGPFSTSKSQGKSVSPVSNASGVSTDQQLRPIEDPSGVPSVPSVTRQSGSRAAHPSLGQGWTEEPEEH